MSTDDTSEVDPDESVEPDSDERGAKDGNAEEVRDRLEREADRAVGQFDQGIVDLLSWVLDTETRARIYVHLRQQPKSTSEEVAEGTGLYPSTVREALAQLHEEGRVLRVKRESSGAGNNPYEYSAISPSDLVQEIVDDVQSELNTVFNLDNYLGGEEEPKGEPVTVSVTEEKAKSSEGNSAESEGTDAEADDSGAAGDDSEDPDVA